MKRAVCWPNGWVILNTFCPATGRSCRRFLAEGIYLLCRSSMMTILPTHRHALSPLKTLTVSRNYALCYRDMDFIHRVKRIGTAVAASSISLRTPVRFGTPITMLE